MSEELSFLPRVSRREFLAFCGGVAALVGLGQGGALDVAAALEKIAKRPSVIWTTFQACTGCAVSLLQSRTPEVAQLLLQQISLDYQDNVMAAAGDAAEKSLQDALEAGGFFWVAEGSVATKIPGAMAIRGRPSTEIAKDVYAKAKATIATGSCATFGNVQAAKPNPTGAKGIADYLKEDAGVSTPLVINLPRCPGNGEDLIAVLSYVLVTGKVPPLDAEGRPKFLYGHLVHEDCFRRGHFEAGQYVESYNDPRIQEGWCLYKLGCKGPVTYAPCGVTQWNGHVSWCVRNAPCIGCSERAFWDKATPFPAQLAGVGGFPAQTIGEVIGAATVVGLGAHFIGQAATGRLGHGGPPEQKKTRGGES